MPKKSRLPLREQIARTWKFAVDNGCRDAAVWTVHAWTKLMPDPVVLADRKPVVSDKKE